MDPDEKYQIKVTSLKPEKDKDTEEKQENPNYSDKYVKDVEEIGFEEIIKRNLSCLLKQYEASLEKDKSELDIWDLPQMIAGQVNKLLIENEGNAQKEYGWHYAISSVFQPGSEAFHINTSVERYYDLTKEEQKAGIFDVIYREFLVDFLLPPKMSNQQFHMVAYRLKRGHDSTIGKAIDTVKSFSVLELLSVASIHKMFFLMLVFVYFANRFIWGKYDRLAPPEPQVSSENSSVIPDEEMGFVESMWRHKNQTILLVAITFIILSVLKQVLKKIKDRQKLRENMRKQKMD